jgi:hypothetical protein
MYSRCSLCCIFYSDLKFYIFSCSMYRTIRLPLTVLLHHVTILTDTTTVRKNKNNKSEPCGKVTWQISNLICNTLISVWPPLWSSGQSSGYRSRGPGFDSPLCQILWEVVRLVPGPLNLVSITEDQLEWKSSGSGSRKPRLTAVGICCPDHATPSSCVLNNNVNCANTT